MVWCEYMYVISVMSMHKCDDAPHIPFVVWTAKPTRARSTPSPNSTRRSVTMLTPPSGASSDGTAGLPPNQPVESPRQLERPSRSDCRSCLSHCRKCNYMLSSLDTSQAFELGHIPAAQVAVELYRRAESGRQVFDIGHIPTAQVAIEACRSLLYDADSVHVATGFTDRANRGFIPCVGKNRGILARSRTFQ